MANVFSCLYHGTDAEELLIHIDINRDKPPHIAAMMSCVHSALVLLKDNRGDPCVLPDLAGIGPNYTVPALIDLSAFTLVGVVFATRGAPRFHFTRINILDAIPAGALVRFTGLVCLDPAPDNTDDYMPTQCSMYCRSDFTSVLTTALNNSTPTWVFAKVNSSFEHRYITTSINPVHYIGVSLSGLTIDPHEVIMVFGRSCVVIVHLCLLCSPNWVGQQTWPPPSQVHVLPEQCLIRVLVGDYMNLNLGASGQSLHDHHPKAT